MKPHSPLWLFLFSALFAVQIIPRFWGDSLTNDEPMEITNGFFYLTHGDVLSHAKHPPFSKALEALPLLALHLKESQDSTDAMDRAYQFFFKDNVGQLGAITTGGVCPPSSWVWVSVFCFGESPEKNLYRSYSSPWASGPSTPLFRLFPDWPWPTCL